MLCEKRSNGSIFCCQLFVYHFFWQDAFHGHKRLLCFLGTPFANEIYIIDCQFNVALDHSLFRSKFILQQVQLLPFMLHHIMRLECFENAEKGWLITRYFPVLLCHHWTCTCDIIILVLITMLNLNQKTSIGYRTVQCSGSLQK